MWKLAIVLLVLNLEMSASDFLAADKKLHVVAGTVIYLGCLFTSGIARNNHIEWINPKTCLIPVYLAAVGKEAYDKHTGGTAEFSDITATVFIPSTGYIIYEWQ